MGKFKNFLLRQALKAKMKDVPKAEQERIITMMEKNPDLFKKISDEVKKKMKGGQSEMAATMVGMRKYQAELQKLMQ